jgi:pimeloyl-ACP methyl ester carboxylesterase
MGFPMLAQNPSWRPTTWLARSVSFLRRHRIAAGLSGGIGALAVYFIGGTALNQGSFYVWKLFSGEAGGGRWASVGDVSIYYETFGSGAPVLLLHGGLGVHEDMSRQIISLAPTHLVIAPDSRGHGRSTDSNEPLSYSLMADDMVSLLDLLHIARVDVVGWSDGAIIGLELAMRHPERVDKLVAISANFDVDGLIQLPDAVVSVPAAPLRYRLFAQDPAHWPTLYTKVVKMWREQPRYKVGDLAMIKSPTLVIAGEFDSIKREHTDLLTRSIPGAQEEIIKGATHAVPKDKPNIVNSLISKFLEAR